MSFDSYRATSPQADKTNREAKLALVRTVDGMEITGIVYLTLGTRTLDLLNRETETFIAMTDCSVSMEGHMEAAPFIAVNKAHITTLREVVR